jgi:hypothetical protein
MVVAPADRHADLCLSRNTGLSESKSVKRNKENKSQDSSTHTHTHTHTHTWEDQYAYGRLKNKPSKHRSGCSQSANGWITGPPMEELEKVPKELKGSATL